MVAERQVAPLRIVHVAATANGAPWMHAQLRELRARGHDVSAIIAGREGNLAPRLDADGIPFEVLDLDVLSSRNLWAAGTKLLALTGMLRRLRPDVVQTHLFPSILLGRIAGWLADVPLRFSMIPGPYYLEAPVLRDADAGTAWADTRVIASCEYTRTLYGQLGVPADRVDLIYYGPDADRFDPATADGARVRSDFGLSAQTPTVGIVAYFYPPLPPGPFTPPHLVGRGIKGHDVLLRAVPRVLARVPEAVFLLVGEGWGPAGREYEAELRALAAELGVAHAVRFTGARHDVPNVLAAFDVSVQCSLNENLGGSLESLLMERPLVASAVGGLVDSVRHESTGLLVPPGDADALGDAIARLLIDRPFAARLAKAGRALALQEFTLSKTVDDLEALYRTGAATIGPAPARHRYRLTRGVARFARAPFKLSGVVTGFLRAIRPGRAVRPAPVPGDVPRPHEARPPRPRVTERLALAAHLGRRIHPADRSGTAPPRVIQMAGAVDNADWFVQICRQLRDDGCDVSAVIGAPEGRLAAALRAAEIPYEAMPLSFAPDWGRWRVIVYLVRVPLAVTRLARLFRRERVQVVHTHIFNTIFIGRLAAWLAGVPARVSMIPGPLHLEARLTRLADQRTCWMDHRVIAGSHWTAACYEQLGVRAPRLTVVPYGSDGRRFRPSAADRLAVRREFALGDSPVIGLVAYFYPPRSGWQTPPALRGRGVKGHEDFLDAAVRVRARYPGARFLLVGGGWGEAGERYRQALMARAAAQGLADAVIFTGVRDDVPRLLAACDVAVQCSHSENYGGTIESLLSEVPTVATRVGGMPETTRDGETGLLVPPGDPEALATAIVALLDDPARARTMARAGRALMLEQFDMAGSTRAIVRIYERLLDRPIVVDRPMARTSA